MRVYIADGHEVLRRGLRRTLEAAGMEVVGETGTAREASGRIPVLLPDVAVIAENFADRTGFWLCADIVRNVPATRCLVLTGEPTSYGEISAVAAGAGGYLSKAGPTPDLITAVRSAAGPVILFASPPLPCDTELGPLVPPPQWETLARQERRVLGCLGQGLSNRQIGVRLNLAEKTVKNYISTVLAKLGLGHRTEAAVQAARYSILDPSFFEPGPATRAVTELQEILSTRLNSTAAQAMRMLENAGRARGTTTSQLARDIITSTGIA